jgi:ubiquinone/menaquinone biosynthesis C-methylase UbiE
MMKSMRRKKDLGIGGWMAHWYDNNTKNHRLKEMKMYAVEVASHIKNGASVLEIAPGPGYLSIELAKLGKYNIVGWDISKDFVEIARKNAKAAGVEVDFREGNAADIISPDSRFDFIICTAAFKNFKEPLKALNEMHRVLKPGGFYYVTECPNNNLWFVDFCLSPISKISLKTGSYFPIDFPVCKRLLLQTANLIRLFRCQKLLFLPLTFTKPL